MSDGFARDVAGLRAFLREQAVSWVHDEATAEDLVHDTLLRALVCRAQFQAGTNLRGWTRSIMRNIFIDGCRRRSRLTTANLEQIPAPPIADEVGMADLFRFEDVRAAACRLPRDDRDMFRLAYLEGASYRQLAARFRLKEATVGTRLHRLRQKLRAILERSLAGSGGRLFPALIQNQPLPAAIAPQRSHPRRVRVPEWQRVALSRTGRLAAGDSGA